MIFIYDTVEGANWALIVEAEEAAAADREARAFRDTLKIRFQACPRETAAVRKAGWTAADYAHNALQSNPNARLIYVPVTRVKEERGE